MTPGEVMQEIKAKMQCWVMACGRPEISSLVLLMFKFAFLEFENYFIYVTSPM
jgi:hypothetical protein